MDVLECLTPDPPPEKETMQSRRPKATPTSQKAVAKARKDKESKIESFRERKFRRFHNRYQLIEQIAKAIQTARKTRGLSQIQLAKQLGTHQGVISRIESARIVPSLDFLQAVANLLQSSFEIKVLPEKRYEVLKIRKAALARFKLYKHRS